MPRIQTVVNFRDAGETVNRYLQCEYVPLSTEKFPN